MVDLSDIGGQQPLKIPVKERQGEDIRAYQHDEHEDTDGLLPLMDDPQKNSMKAGEKREGNYEKPDVRNRRSHCRLVGNQRNNEELGISRSSQSLCAGMIMVTSLGATEASSHQLALSWRSKILHT